MRWRSLCGGTAIAMLLLAGGGGASAAGRRSFLAQQGPASHHSPGVRDRAPNPEHGTPGRGSGAFVRAHVVVGVVAAVSGASLRVGTRTIVLAAGSGVWQHGKTAQAAPGQEVAVVLSGGQGVMVDILSPGNVGTPPARGAQVVGTVQQVRGHDLLLAVGGGASVAHAVYALTEQTALSGTVSSPAAIAPGDQVAISAGTHRHIVSIDVTQAVLSVSGTVDLARGGWLQLTTTAAGRLAFRAPGGTRVAVDLAGTGTAGGGEIHLSELVPGEGIRVRAGQDGRAAAVTLTSVPSSAAPSGVFAGRRNGRVWLIVGKHLVGYRTADGLPSGGIAAGQPVTLLLNGKGQAVLVLG